VIGKQEMVGAIDAVCDVAQRIIGKLKEGAGAGGPSLPGAAVGNSAGDYPPTPAMKRFAESIVRQKGIEPPPVISKSKKGLERPHKRESTMSRTRLSIGGVCLAVALIAASSVAFGQASNPNPASPRDLIVARKTLMNTIGTNMYPIDEMLETGKIDLAAARINLESISAMLMAFPNLFAPSTNLWFANAKRDPATDTLADAAIWESRSFFYRDAMAASKYAFEASRAQNVADFRKAARDLRLTCDGCHSTYQHKD